MAHLGIVMDPIESITPHKDTTLALMLSAQARGWQCYYIKQTDIYAQQDQAYAYTQPVEVFDDAQQWFRLGGCENKALSEFSVILMRKDPPFDMRYIYSTYLLDLAKKQGVLVVNDPNGLRDANEKMFLTHFHECMPATVVSSRYDVLKQFIREQGEVVLKPLHGMGGMSIFRLTEDDANLTVILENMTQRQTLPIMAQRYLAEIVDGDKRILLVNGEPIAFALARVPASGETRGNIMAGGKGESRPLTDRDRWLCEKIGPTLQQMGLYFVGLDVIGDYVTEINVTSPTCVRELNSANNLSIGDRLFDFLEANVKLG